MKKLNVILLFAGLGITQACNNSASDDSVEKADSTNEARDTTGMSQPTDTTSGVGVNDNVADFAVEAANGGMMEVKLGEYASKNAIDKRVKNFGSMMVKDHTKANNELKGIATSKNIAIPSTVGEDKTQDMNDLMKKTGKDFDKAYMEAMVKDHKDDIDLFQKTADNSKDSAMKAFAAKALPTLKKHLDSAEAIVKANNY